MRNVKISLTRTKSTSLGIESPKRILCSSILKSMAYARCVCCLKAYFILLPWLLTTIETNNVFRSSTAYKSIFQPRRIVSLLFVLPALLLSVLY